MESKKRLVRPDRILEMLGVSRVTLWKYIRDGKFPAPIKIGATRNGLSAPNHGKALDS